MLLPVARPAKGLKRIMAPAAHSLRMDRLVAINNFFWRSASFFHSSVNAFDILMFNVKSLRMKKGLLIALLNNCIAVSRLFLQNMQRRKGG